MKFTQINFLNNEIPDYPELDLNSESRGDTTPKPETMAMTQDVVDSSSESNKRTPSPLTQKEAKPIYHTLATPINNAMSQLNLNMTHKPDVSQPPLLILRSATATILSHTATMGPSQRSGRGGGGGDGQGGGGGGGGGRGGDGGRGGQSAAVA
jgi:hypothetical protein